MGWVNQDALYRAHLNALRLVEVANALGAAGRIDFVDFFAGSNRVIRAFRLANVAIDALVGNE